MRILQLCKKFPYPLKDGEAIAIHNLTKAFYQLGHEVTVLAINTKKHFYDRASKKLPQEFEETADYYDVYVDTDIKIKNALFNLFTKNSFNIKRFESKAYQYKLVELLEERDFDFIQLEGVYLAPYLDTIRAHSKAPVAMRAHNVEFTIWASLAKGEKNKLRRGYLNLLARRLKLFEIKQLNAYDAIVPITQRDAEHFRLLGSTLPMFVSPTGIDPQRLVRSPSKRQFPSVFHIGSLDWLPNQEGILWFLDNVWSKVAEQHPDIKFYVAGRNMSSRFAQLTYPNLEILGEVEDAVEFMNQNTIMVVPLRSGSGMRIKIIEALALGKTVISTTVGAEGIGAKAGKEILLADDAKAFYQQLDKCLNDRLYCEKIGNQAFDFAHCQFNNIQIAQRLIEFYSKVACHTNSTNQV